jgi:hypothetical protein
MTFWSLVAEFEPYAYAVRIEKHLLGEYATRMGIEEEVSLLKPKRAGSKLSDTEKPWNRSCMKRLP